MAMLLVRTTLVMLDTVARTMSYVDMTLFIPLAQDMVILQVHTIKSATRMMLVLMIMGNMTASTDRMKERKETVLLTLKPSRIVVLNIMVTLVYCVGMTVCITISGADKTGPCLAIQDSLPTILFYAGTISGTARDVSDMVVMASYKDLVKDVPEEQNIVTTLPIQTMILTNIKIGELYLAVKTNQIEYTRITLSVQ